MRETGISCSRGGQDLECSPTPRGGPVDFEFRPASWYARNRVLVGLGYGQRHRQAHKQIVGLASRSHELCDMDSVETHAK